MIAMDDQSAFYRLEGVSIRYAQCVTNFADIFDANTCSLSPGESHRKKGMSECPIALCIDHILHVLTLMDYRN